jgi:Escherichia/Staphylococcus phage prohead protease
MAADIAAEGHLSMEKNQPRTAADDGMVFGFRSFTPDLEVQSGGDGRLVRGIAVPYNQPQRIDASLTEEFVRGAFDHQMNAIHRVRFWNGHSVQGGVLIGHTVEARDDASGLYGEWRVAKTRDGDDALELIKNGTLDQLSIGFRVTAGGSQRTLDGVVQRTKANLFEVAVVPEGAYGEGATITGVRAVVDGVCPHCGHVETPAEPAVRSRLIEAQSLRANLRPLA